MIKPSRPTIHPDYHIGISLDKSQVNIADIKDKAQAEGYREQVKRHITIVGSDCRHDVLVEKIDKLSGQEKENFINKIKILLDEFDWMYSQGDLYHISKRGIFLRGSTIFENRESYVRVIDMPDMEKFHWELNRLMGTNIPAQFPHITLFTKGERPDPDYFGIAVSSKEEFLKMNPEKIES